MCSATSLLASRAMPHAEVLRITKETWDMDSPSVRNKLIDHVRTKVEAGFEVHLWASVPCLPWSARTDLNMHKLGPQYRAYIRKLRSMSAQILRDIFDPC